MVYVMSFHYYDVCNECYCRQLGSNNYDILTLLLATLSLPQNSTTSDISESALPLRCLLK